MRSGALAARRLVEPAAAPQIRKAGKQDADEHDAFDVAGPAEVAKRDRPGEDERRLEIEDDEEDRYQVERGVEAQPRRSRRDDA